MNLSRWLMHFFDWLYTSGAWAYDAVAAAVSLGCWRRWVRSVTAWLPPTGPVLELGYGPGHLQAALAGQGHTAYGADASLPMARRAARRLRRRDGPARLVVAQGQALPFAGQTFTAVVATFPTPYIFAPQTVDEVARVLRPQGRVVMLLTAAHPVLTMAERILALLGGHPFAEVGDVETSLRERLQPWAAAFALEIQPWPLPCGARGILVIGMKKGVK